MSSDVRIAVSGKSGCGNTTVSRILAERLGIRLINYTFHDMAKERGITFEQLCLLAETDSQYDRHLDRRQVELAMDGSCVLASRLAIWLLEQADLKVYLHASAEVRGKRIAQREGIPWRRSVIDIEARDSRDRNRYLKLYDIDIDEYGFADLIVDTELGDQYYVVEKIIDFFEKRP
ncbi:MAG: cytidylate kinase family protein [Spirochaetaceae bacterium]|nr:MAG: cytidylate kinase family protein [Spirochaetaceae bacterium]